MAPQNDPDPSKDSAQPPRARVDEIRRAIRVADDEYYNQGAPSLSDREYDALFRELRSLEATHPQLLTEDSPTQRVGAPLPKGSGFQKAEHLAPMLSIESLTDSEQVDDFDGRVRRLLGLGEDNPPVGYAVEPKLDGVSASLLYEEGELVRGLSRGDGAMGEDITANLKTVRGVPRSLDRNGPTPPPARIEIRGEVIIGKEAFGQFQAAQQTSGESSFRNPRNTVAGSLKLLDPGVVARRPLDFIAWGTGRIDGLDASITTVAQLRKALTGWGLMITEPFEEVVGPEGIKGYHQSVESARDRIDYEMDGIVAKVSRLDWQNRLGRTARTPRWVLAYKFAAQVATTKVLDIRSQVGRTGAVTPVADLEPVPLAGVTVSHATLHNWGLLRERDIRVGDTVDVERAGDVIPKVIRVHTDRREEDSSEVIAPEQCPSCGSGLEAEGAFVYCTNLECPAQLRGRLTHMTGRRTLDIEGLGPKNVDALMQGGVIQSIEDLWQLPARRDAIEALEGWGARSFEKLAEQIQQAKTPTLDRFINSLGIRHVGEQTARDLAAHFGTFDALQQASEEELVEVDGVGLEVAKAIRGFFTQPGNLAFLEACRGAGVDVQAVAVAAGDLEGRTFCFTGGMDAMGRDEARELVEARGAKTSASVTKKVTDVVAGPGAGSKLEKARKLGCNILDEAAFLALVGRAP